MPLSHYLNAKHVCILKEQSPEAAIEQLVSMLCRDRPDLSREEVLNAVLERERNVGTGINSVLALPHARLAGVGRPVIAAGLSREGIAWAGVSGGKLHLILLLLGDEENPNDVLAAMALLARTFQSKEVLGRILSATSADALYHALVEQAGGREIPPDPGRQAAMEAVYASAGNLAEETQAGCLMVMVDQPTDLGFVSKRPAPCRVLLVTSPRRQLAAPELPFELVLEVPMRGLLPRQVLDFALLMAVSRGRIDPEQRVVCLYGSADADHLDTIRVLDVFRNLRIPLSLHDELESGELDFQVLLRVFTLATELAREGREGKSIGALFVLGDYEHVSTYCQQMVINPFKGYSDDGKNILDPSLSETVKEFAHIDGAFIIRADGVIMSAGSFIRADVMGDRLESGLGARHTAGQAITACTKALSMVLSESTGTLTLYKDGKSVFKLRRGGN